MAKYDPKFWEVTVDPAILESVLIESDLLSQLLDIKEDESTRDLKDSEREAALKQIRALISTSLTDKQRVIVELYFFKQMTQQEIAKELRINQQVVSKHLFGAIREGRKVGGAMNKIRKLCKKHNIDPKKWV